MEDNIMGNIERLQTTEAVLALGTRKVEEKLYTDDEVGPDQFAFIAYPTIGTTDDEDRAQGKETFTTHYTIFNRLEGSQRRKMNGELGGRPVEVGVIAVKLYEYQSRQEKGLDLVQDNYHLEVTFNLIEPNRREVKIIASPRTEGYTLHVGDGDMYEFFHGARIQVNESGIQLLPEPLQGLVRYAEEMVPQLFARGFALQEKSKTLTSQ